MDGLEWQFRHFNQLSALDLYQIMQLRSAVFVVEQNCPYQDADGLDLEAYHLTGHQNETLVAYTRLLPPGLAYEQPSIGRVITSAAVRKGGFGKLLMQKSMDACEALFGKTDIKIGAQFYLKNFYENLGFEQVSEIYLEDGIEHIYMIKK
jgi:ElaA protein